MTGLHNLRARNYDPSVGRFLNQDSAALATQNPLELNRYVYTADNPVTIYDPSGHQELAEFGIDVNQRKVFASTLAGGTAGYVSSAVLVVAVNLGTCGDYRFDYSTARDFIAESTLQGAQFGFETGVLGQISPEVNGAFILASLTKGAESLAQSSQISTACQIGALGVGVFISGRYESLFTKGSVAGNNQLPPPTDSGNMGIDPNNEQAGTGNDNAGSSDSNGNNGDEEANGGTCSFRADTPVATDNGEKPIASLKVGDKVEEYNRLTSQVELKAIDAVLVHLDFQLEDLTIDGETLHTTPNHPFYTQDKGWVAAGNLVIGEGILKADGSYGKVQVVREIDRAQTMYNLTVHDDHDYFVGNGQWLVHNANRCEFQNKSGSIADANLKGFHFNYGNLDEIKISPKTVKLSDGTIQYQLEVSSQLGKVYFTPQVLQEIRSFLVSNADKVAEINRDIVTRWQGSTSPSTQVRVTNSETLAQWFSDPNKTKQLIVVVK